VETREISQLINALTSNEDHRQDLWVDHLTGTPVEQFVSHLKAISVECSQHETVRLNIWRVFNQPPSEKFYQLIVNFSEFEQSVICLLMLGLTITEISGYKGISEIRMRQAISSIKQRACWKELYGIEEETDGRGVLRS